jgi:hypothetical protein
MCVESRDGIPDAGRPLHADRDVEVRADELVLLGLDGGDNVTHRPDAGPLDLLELLEKDSAGADVFAGLEVFVLEAGEVALDEAEPPSHVDVLRVAGAGLVETCATGARASRAPSAPRPGR